MFRLPPRGVADMFHARRHGYEHVNCGGRVGEKGDGSVEQGVHEALGLEGREVVGSLAEADELDRHP